MKVIILSLNSFFLICYYLGSDCPIGYTFSPFQLQTQPQWEKRDLHHTHETGDVVFQDRGVRLDTFKFIPSKKKKMLIASNDNNVIHTCYWN